MSENEHVATRRRPMGGQTVAVISPLPPPEEVFIDWLLSVPAEDCLEAAARYQIKVIDRSGAPLHPDVRTLRTLLSALAGEVDWNKPISNL